jgi:hypothetical protein
MAEKKVIELDLQTNLGSLKSQLKQAQADVQILSDKFGATSQAAAEAAKKAADLKDRIQDAKALTDAFNPDAKFTSLTRSLGGALDGFQAFEGALGLIGVESEDLQKTLLKVQSAMAFSQGIQGALEAKDSFIQLGSVVKNTFSAMTTASKAFLVGGIGLIIAAIGIVVANYDDWFGASKKVAEQQKVISEQAKEQRQNIAKESGEFATLISRLKNTNEGSKERADLIKKINGQYGTTLKNIKDEAKFQESLNKELASYLEYQKAKYKLQKNEELIVKNLEKQDELASKIAKSKKDEAKARKEQADSGGSNAIMLRAINSQVELQGRLNKELEDAQKRFEYYGSAANNASAKVDKLTNSGTKYVEQTKDKVDKVEKNNDKEFESYDKLEYKKAQLLKHSELTLQGHINETVKLQTDAAEHELAILEAKATRAAQIDEASHSKKVELAKAGLSAIAQITELFGKKSEKAAKQAFKIQKAANIASALVTTYQSATAAYASQFTPLPDPSSPVRGAIAAGIAIASGLANVAKIGQQKFEGGAPSGGGGGGNNAGGGSTVVSPNFNVVGNSGINQLAQLQQTPTKAYVVSGDMSTAQSLDRNRIENATLVK